MECEGIDVQDTPLRQGDIIAAQPGSASWAVALTRFGVILSADCDLAQRKTGPNLVYVPILDSYSYLSELWVPEAADDITVKAKDRITGLLSELDPKIEIRHVERWASDGGVEQIKQRVVEMAERSFQDKNIDKLLSKVDGLWNAISELNALRSQPTDTRSIVVRFLKARAAVDNVEFCAQYSRKAIESEFLSLQERIDSALIRELVGLDEDMKEYSRFAYVVPLRKFALLPVDRVDILKDRWYGNKDHYLRICRLKYPYRTDLVQKFANLFLRVGLEDRRVEEHRRVFNRVATSLFPEEAR